MDILKTAVIAFLFTSQAYATENLELQKLGNGNQFLVQGTIELPEGQKLNKSGPSNITVYEKVRNEWKQVAKLDLNSIFTVSDKFPYSLPVSTSKGMTPVKVKASIYHCDRVKNNFCVIDEFEGTTKRSKGEKNRSILTLDLKGSSPRE